MERGNKLLKIVDRYIGIPLIFMLSFCRSKKKILPTTIQRIAFIKGAAIGDTVLLSAIIQDLRLAYPQAELHFFCGKTCVDIARMIPGLDEVVFIPTTKPIKAIRMLRGAGKYDVVIDTGPWTRLEALLTFFTKGTYKIGFKSLAQHRHFCYDHVALHTNMQHELDNNRALLKPLVDSTPHLPVLKIPSLDVGQLLLRVGIKKQPFWVLHPWSGGFKGFYKEWPLNRWVEVAKWLSAQGFQIAFSGAKANKSDTQHLVEACRSEGFESINLAGQTSLPELVVVLKEASGVVSVNTGVLHIAAAVGSPVVGINGPVPSLRWGAVSKNAINLDCRPPLKGYIHLGFEYPASPPQCMESIDVSDVITAIIRLLDHASPNINTVIK